MQIFAPKQPRQEQASSNFFWPRTGAGFFKSRTDDGFFRPSNTASLQRSTLNETEQRVLQLPALGVIQTKEDKGAKMQEEQSQALHHGLNPDEQWTKPLETLEPALSEAIRFFEALPPEPTRPGDPAQQEGTIPVVNPYRLWI